MGGKRRYREKTSSNRPDPTISRIFERLSRTVFMDGNASVASACSGRHKRFPLRAIRIIDEKPPEKPVLDALIPG
jgi:hypothetical protein